ncbi:response regulator transcription factor [Lacinutrix jangbogonensis]|uniref:response regulator transcription factor n=1 Tax=Lacinutrix jangbogonensis TaxID=1469557 RepID=UPI00053EC4FF|nr:response regulator transcription factor [Lacinutrix jangbogonensis]
MKNKEILIVEDELIIAENLRFILNKYGYNCVDVAGDVEEAKQLFTIKTYDLVLMDINLGGNSALDGIDLIKHLLQKYDFIYIYITANADEKTIEKAKTTQPSSYIVKPFITTTIYANVAMALNSINDKACFTYTNKGMQDHILLSKIKYVEADGNYINIYPFSEKIHFVRKSLAEFLELYTTIFIRIHKSVIINKHTIQGYNSQYVRVNNKNLPLGRTYKENFLEQIKDVTFLD